MAWTSWPSDISGSSRSLFKEVAGSGKSQVTFDLVPLDRATAYAAEDADITLRLWLILKARLAAEHRVTVYETLERPLSPVLAAMERTGILVDRTVLARLSGRFRGQRAELRGQGARDRRRTSSTSAHPSSSAKSCSASSACRAGKQDGDRGLEHRFERILDDLAAEGVELAQTVLDWRQLSKLRSTYSDALPGFTSTRKPAGCTPPMPWRPRRPGGWHRPTRTCRTFRCAPKRAARSAPPSLPTRATS